MTRLFSLFYYDCKISILDKNTNVKDRYESHFLNLPLKKNPHFFITTEFPFHLFVTCYSDYF